MNELPSNAATVTHLPQSVDMGLSDAVRIIWSWRGMVISVTLVAMIISVIIALELPKQYEATVLLAPASDDSDGRGGGLSALVSQYGGLSALGGLNFGSANRKAEAIATLESRTLTMTFIEERHLLPILFHDQWDEGRRQWKTKDPSKIPTLLKAEELFSKDVRVVTENKKTGLITMTITWSDPALASDWANELVERTNQFLRQKATEQSSRNIAYLNEQLTRSSVVELQKSIYQLIEAEIKKTMVAQGSNEYAFKVIDPAVTPEHKIKPRRALIVLIGTFLGGLLASVIALAIGQRRTPTTDP
jgi:uncharacterized protein involved in exopolysaccharide biosynthesis